MPLCACLIALSCYFCSDKRRAYAISALAALLAKKSQFPKKLSTYYFLSQDQFGFYGTGENYFNVFLSYSSYFLNRPLCPTSFIKAISLIRDSISPCSQSRLAANFWENSISIQFLIIMKYASWNISFSHLRSISQKLFSR